MRIIYSAIMVSLLLVIYCIAYRGEGYDATPVLILCVVGIALTAIDSNLGQKSVDLISMESKVEGARLVFKDLSINGAYFTRVDSDPYFINMLKMSDVPTVEDFVTTESHDNQAVIHAVGESCFHQIHIDTTKNWR